VPVGGVLQPITIPATGGLTKYQRPVFGNGRVYVTGSNVVFGLGTPVTLPLSCAGPANFGSLNVGQTSTVQITCKALAAATINGCSTSLATFQCQNSSLPLTVASGASFTFPVTWNLTQAAINQAQSNGHFQVLPGSEDAALDLYTAGASGYATDTPIQLSGTVVAPQGYLVINASEVDFGGIVLGGPVSQFSSSVILSNQGTSVLTFSGFAWQDMYANGSPFNNVSVLPANQPTIVGNGFTATNFPTVGSQLSPG
jgi:iron transport multicopper oxidase